MDKLKSYLERQGISNPKEIIHNPSYEEIFQAEIDPGNSGFEKGILTKSGAVAVKTGIFTGRSPKDRYIVKDNVTEDTIWWDGHINRPTSVEIFDELKDVVTNDLSDRKSVV